MMADQMVQLDSARALAREQAPQCRQFVRHRDSAGWEMPSAVPSPTVTHRRAIGARETGAARSARYAAGAMPLDRCRDLALHAAARGVRDQDHRLAAAAPRRAPARQVEASPRLRQRIGLRMRRISSA